MAIDFGFVILNYTETQITMDCVKKIRKTNLGGQPTYAIAVVDNGSPNGSGAELQTYYKDSYDVEVILNPTNDGFAKGNNLGYEHLKRKYSPKFIVVMNNDIFIEQENIFQKVVEIYERTHFAVLGPDIYSLRSQQHQNPLRNQFPTYAEVSNWYRGNHRAAQWPLLMYLKTKVNAALKKSNQVSAFYNCEYSQEIENAILHGACYIFGPEFIEKREYCFNPQTYFYGEEYILYVECSRQGLKMLYSPEIKVNHLDGASTHRTLRSEYKRYKFTAKSSAIANKLLLDMMRDAKDDDSAK